MRTIFPKQIILLFSALLFLWAGCKRDCPEGDFEILGSNQIAPADVEFSLITTTDDVTSIKWDFGDGNTLLNESRPVHNYSQPGTYDVTVTFFNNDSKCSRVTLTKPVTVLPSAPTTADFSVSSTTDCPPPCTVSFTNLSQNANTYDWDFGAAGATSTSANPNYTYSNAGTYTVTLVAEGIGGATATRTKTVIIPPVSQGGTPVAAFSFTNQNCIAPCGVTFINQSTGASQYRWDFGDGQPVSNDPNPVHVYNQAGNYNATLIATNSSSKSDTISKTVNIKALSDTSAVKLEAVILNNIGTLGCFVNDGMPDVSYRVVQENGSNDLHTGIAGITKVNATIPAVWLCSNCLLDPAKTYYIEFLKHDDNVKCVIGRSADLVLPNYSFPSGTLNVNLTVFATNWQVQVNLEKQ